jgi:hypothetical protein
MANSAATVPKPVTEATAGIEIQMQMSIKEPIFTELSDARARIMLPA